MSTLDENILSLRIVTLDYYLQVPLPELDPCYSQFRGSPVDKVRYDINLAYGIGKYITYRK